MEPNYLNARLKFGQRLTLLLSCFVLCLIATAFLNVLLVYLIGNLDVKVIRISIILQNIFAFIFPVIATVVIISSNPLQFLKLNRAPQIKYLLFMLAIMVFGMPFLNWLVDINKSMELPESMSAIEEWMRNSEASAELVTKSLISGQTFGIMILNILLVGILTGFGEEMFFRGALQRILSTRPLNIHIAIWISAFIFSLLHFQFFGFLPRMILGAFFGYLLYWSGNLWVPIIAHALNNSMVVITSYIYPEMLDDNIIENIGVADGNFPIMAILSALSVIILIILFNRSNKRKVN
ncbi:MAG: type II CAAX endopeptidase family protein [Muribaculaceae bacterium]|nr:type II CAAX endopeptidase family protein [Muribaculaceae bacterium]